ncbi:DUF7144 family membrane protein [Aeromicrobium massiliense]|uniref:DUF7144 family membrane protein n=1 Tax=Aeromicrobium massiliense TaxID=1464554 RepID=UPI00031A3975|nr:hypothetical protein [Aeromicrobium massiliense]
MSQDGTSSTTDWIAYGFIKFAATMMVMLGVFHGFMGTVALVRGTLYVETPEYVLDLDTTAWGWIHLIAGVVVLAGAFAVLSGRMWGRVVGVVVAFASALLNFAFIPYYPVWAVLVIVLDVGVIWALTMHGDLFPTRDPREP